MAYIGIPLGLPTVSWGTSGDFVYGLTTYQKLREFSWNSNGGTWDASGAADKFVRTGKGMKSCSFQLVSHLATPADGLNGLVTYASGTVLHLLGYKLSIKRKMDEIKRQTGSNAWVEYVPGRPSLSGTYTGLVDDTTGFTAPLAPINTAGGGSATFQVIPSGSGKAIVSKIVANSIGAKANGDGKNEYSCSFIGDDTITTTGTSTSALWPADADGSKLSAKEDGKTLTLTYFTGLTLSGYAYWTGIDIDVQPDSPIIVTVNGVFSGTVTGLSV